jgi:hypothetical protein
LAVEASSVQKAAADHSALVVRRSVGDELALISSERRGFDERSEYETTHPIAE